MIVYVLDAWNDTTQQSVVLVFRSRLKALRAEARLVKRRGAWYTGVVRRVVR
jgi:hypothetical protein